MWRMLALKCGESGELDPLSFASGRMDWLAVHRFAPEGAHTTEWRVCNRGQTTGPSGQSGSLFRPYVYDSCHSLGILLDRASWHAHHQLSVCAEPYPVMPVPCGLLTMCGWLLMPELNNIWDTVYQKHQDGQAKDTQQSIHSNLQVCEWPVGQHFFSTSFYLCCSLPRYFHLGGEVVIIDQIPRGFHSASKANTPHILHYHVVWAIAFTSVTGSFHNADINHTGRITRVSQPAGLTHSSEAAAGYEGLFCRLDGGCDLLHNTLHSIWGCAAYWRILGWFPRFLLTAHLFPVITISTVIVLAINNATVETGIVVWPPAVHLKFNLEIAIAHSHGTFPFGLLAGLTDGHLYSHQNSLALSLCHHSRRRALHWHHPLI